MQTNARLPFRPASLSRPARALACALALLLLAPAAVAESWFVSFERINVAQRVKRSDVTQLVDGGSIVTDGFTELVFSFGGVFKAGLPSAGKLGAILLPDEEIVDYLLRNEGHFAFPLEVEFDVAGLKHHVFISSQQTAKVAFPRYRIYFFNETTSAAVVSLFVYRNRY